MHVGNFWWSTAGYLHSRVEKIEDRAWTEDERGFAEFYLLKGVDVEKDGYSKHLNVYKISRNLYKERIPRSMYEYDVENVNKGVDRTHILEQNVYGGNDGVDSDVIHANAQDL